MRKKCKHLEQFKHRFPWMFVLMHKYVGVGVHNLTAGRFAIRHEVPALEIWKLLPPSIKYFSNCID